MQKSRISKIEEQIAALEARRVQVLQRARSEDRKIRNRQAMLLGLHVLYCHENRHNGAPAVGNFIRKVIESQKRHRDKELLENLIAESSVEGSATAAGSVSQPT